MDALANTDLPGRVSFLRSSQACLAALSDERLYEVIGQACGPPERASEMRDASEMLRQLHSQIGKLKGWPPGQDSIPSDEDRITAPNVGP